MKFTEIEVTEEEVKDPPPADTELENKNISTVTVEGEEGPIGPVEAPQPVYIEPVKEEEPVRFAAEMPVYPGGEAAMLNDIAKNIVYPEFEKENNIQGVVMVEFTVEKDGSISNVKVVREVQGGKNLGRAAENAVKKLKNFTPAKQNGNPVRLTMTVPVRFTLK